MVRLSVRPVTRPLRAPIRTAWGDLHERTTLHVRLEFDDGSVGEGEAAPLEPYDGVSLAATRAALSEYADVLAAAAEESDAIGGAAADPGGPSDALRGAAADPGERSDALGDVAARSDASGVAGWRGPGSVLLDACRAVNPLPQALAAIDLALWDRASKRASTPIAQLIAADAATTVPVNATVGAAPDAAAQAAAAVRAGFRCIKVKVGTGEDAQRLAAVRAAVGPDVTLRVDANGAWETPAAALAQLHALTAYEIELCEEPVHGVEAIRVVAAASPVPIALDETHAPAAGAAPLVCLKIARGGISALLDDAAAARAAGAEVYLASTFDGPLGIAAAVHAAAALKLTRPCGLATLDDPASPLHPRAGAIAVPRTPGLATDPQ